MQHIVFVIIQFIEKKTVKNCRPPPKNSSCPLPKHIQRRMDTSVSSITHHLNDWNHWVCYWIRVTGLAGVSNRECKWPYVCLSMPLLIAAQDSDSLFPLRWLLSLLCLTLSFLFAIPSVTVLLFHVIISYLSYFCVSRPPSYSSHLLDSPLPFLPRLPVTRHGSSKPSTKSKKTVSLCSCYLLRHVSMNYFFTFVCRCCICCIALYLICFPRNLLSCSTESPRIATVFSKQCVRNKMLTRWIIYAIFVSATNLLRNKSLSWHNLNVCVSREPNFYTTCVYSASLHRKGLHLTQRKVPHENLLHGLLPVEIGQKSDWTILSRIARWNLLHQNETYSTCTPFRSTNIDMPICTKTQQQAKQIIGIA